MKLLDAKVSHKMLKWIEHYLQESRQEAFKHGVPQGGVLSPTLFALFMNSIREILDPRIKAAMYADDLANNQFRKGNRNGQSTSSNLP